MRDELKPPLSAVLGGMQTTGDDLEVLVRRVEMTLTSAQVAGLREGWALVKPMLERLRSYDQGCAAVPAHVFRADAGRPRPDETETS